MKLDNDHIAVTRDYMLSLVGTLKRKGFTCKRIVCFILQMMDRNSSFRIPLVCNETARLHMSILCVNGQVANHIEQRPSCGRRSKACMVYSSS